MFEDERLAHGVRRGRKLVNDLLAAHSHGNTAAGQQPERQGWRSWALSFANGAVRALASGEVVIPGSVRFVINDALGRAGPSRQLQVEWLRGRRCVGR